MKENIDRHPPKWADYLLERFCRKDIREALQGDLYELFYQRTERMGSRMARWHFVWDVTKAMRFFSFPKPSFIGPGMYKNYIVTGLRGMAQNKVHTAISMLGLGLGMACFFIIAFYARHELKYDRFHTDHERIYRVNEHIIDQEGIIHSYASTFYPLAPAIESRYSGIEESCRLFRMSNTAATSEVQISEPTSEQMYMEDRYFFVDSNFLSLFSYELIEGDAMEALKAPYTVVLTERSADKYFGTASPMGKTLKLKDNRNEYEFIVSGVLKNPPKESHLQFDFLSSFSTLTRTMPWMNNWHHPYLHTYLKLEEGRDVAALQKQLDQLPEEVLSPEEAAQRSYTLTPITDIHLKSHLENEIAANGHMSYVYLFILIGIAILLIACINFMNLSTAQANKRGKEIGVRKSLGATKSQIIQQFLGESYLFTGISFVLAILLTRLLLPYFNEVMDMSLTANFLSDSNFAILIVLMLMAVGLTAGTYPSFFMSAFKTVSIIKGRPHNPGSQGSGIRKGLVISQFVISCGLIAFTIVIYNQVSYMQNKHLGFVHEALINIPLRDTENQMNHKTLKDQWLQIPGVMNVSASSGIPTKEGLHNSMIKPKNAHFDSLEMMTLTVDPNFKDVYQLDLVQGRNFSQDRAHDAQHAIIVNESALQKLGWEDDPIGRELTLNYYFRGEQEKKAQVIGVVRDFNYHSLHKPVIPIIMHLIPNSYYHDYLTVQLAGNDIQTTIHQLSTSWKSFNAKRPFEYSFLDETFAGLYEKESQLNRLFIFFSLIAIMIACLGLFALAAHTCSERTKEIGIRKVMGASNSSIVLLLTNQFGRLVLLAFILSVPVSWYLCKQWLANFAYQIDLTMTTFIIAGILAVLIAGISISFHTIRAAVSKPIHSLRHE